MTTPLPPDLTKLNYIDIKESLTSFLKNQTLFIGYNFEGTVIQTLIDLLAYNTYYYAFYSNMISNEVFLDSSTRLESLVSLVKPLGYTIPGKKSSTAIVGIIQNVTTIDKYSEFAAYSEDGIVYTFYNLYDINLTENEATNITITEGSRLIRNNDITHQINLEKQRFILNEQEVDISTIKVEVKMDNIIGYETWNLVNNFPNNEDKIYYIERMGNIFTIEFGKENNLGKSITSTDFVRITYLISSGILSNGVTNFSLQDAIVTTEKNASGGNDGPDLNLVRFAAPKIFSAQERAVTVTDYPALLVKNNYITNVNQISIYGGDQLSPPKYGRVFVSFLTGLGNSNEIISFLREKNMLTVIPEYIVPAVFDIQLTCASSSETTETTKTAIRNMFNEDFVDYSTYSFGLEFNFGNFQTKVQNLLGGNITFNTMKFSTTLKNSPVTEINLGNRIDVVSTNLDISENFNYVLDTEDTAESYHINLPNNEDTTPQELLLIKNDNNEVISEAGQINLNTGHIVFNKIYTGNELKINITSENKNIVNLLTIPARFTLKLL